MAATIPPNLMATHSGQPNGASSHRAGVGGGKNEPLQRFTDAKKHMGEIYTDLGAYVNQLAEFYNDLTVPSQASKEANDTSTAGKKPPFTVPAEQLAEVERFRASIATIKEMFGRDKMKVTFFGRTSNGKSTVINAMLHARVLPQGMGHTTCCFLQVEGGSENDKHFVKEGEQQKLPIEELDTVGHALSAGNSNDSLIRIFYPKSSSRLLQNDVVIVDSPGVDVSAESDGWIDKHCLDADVFVLVCNSESTLTKSEKDFFHRVSAKLAHPNVFILNNRWDAAAGEEERRREQLREQHQKRLTDFLVNELKVCSAAQAKDRFFFVSAREMLEARLKARGEIKNAYQQEGFQRRAMEFTDFEAHFERLISKSAIKTKFEAHERRARDIITQMRYNLDTVHHVADVERKRLALDLELRSKEFMGCRDGFRRFQQHYLAEVGKVRAEVHLKVSADFADEIQRLEGIFDRFKCAGNEGETVVFSDDPELIDVYKQSLAAYVDRVVTADLESRCTGGLVSRIWTLEQGMYDYTRQLVGDKWAAQLDHIWRYKQPFKFAVAVNCPSMVRDFHADLEFRFSLGVESIARRLLALTRGQPITSIGGDLLSRRAPAAAATAEKQEVDTFIAKVFVQSAAYLANGSIGIAVAGLIIYKNVDWRWIAGAAGLVGGLYAYERYKWNSGAKEERLKEQFRSHLEQRMQQVEHLHTGQCENQVVNELDAVFEGLKATVAGINKEQKESIDRTKRDVEKIGHVVDGLNALKGKTSFVSSNLEAFAVKFLTANSP